MASLSSVLKLTLLDGVTGPARRIQGVLSTFQRQQTSMLAPMRGIGGQLLAFGAGYLGVTKGISGTVGAAIEFESAFADVRKVVDASDEQFQNMSRTIKSMSRELPMTSVEIAQLFAAAGESGVATTDLKAFAEMAARVGIAFDMSAGEAGESLAKLKTQLGLSVAETGDMADAINHLSNNMASKASQITDYMLRIGALSKMGGFAKEEIAAIGSAMIAAGAQAEQAGTAMQNVVKAMTKGDFAKKGQREVAKALGLDLPTIAKEMQKDAPKALKKVLGAIAKAPKDQHIALLSDFFGDEAKAFAPLIGNIGLLDKALDSVANKTNYSGSAFREYVARAGTTANALQILRNKIAYVFEDMGEAWLPTIKEGVAAIGGVLDTLGERASVFDKLGASIQGFTQGLGFDGGVKEAIAAMGDLLFGEVDGDGAADKLGSLFAKFEGYGQTIRQLKKDFEDNPIVKFLGELAGDGFKFMLVAAGIGILGGAIMKLGRALAFLTGITTAVAIFKAFGKLGGILSSVKVPELGGGKPGGKPGDQPGANPSSGWGVGWKSFLAAFQMADAIAGMPDTKEGVEELYKKNREGAGEFNKWLDDRVTTPAEMFRNMVDPFRSSSKDEARTASMDSYLDDFGPKSEQWEGGRHRAGSGAGPSAGEGVVTRSQPVGATVGNDTLLPSKVGLLLSALSSMPSQYQQDRPTSLDAGTISQLLQPSRGVQEVRVTNKEPPNVTVSNVFNITGVSSPEAAADAAASRLGQAVKSAVESSYSD